MSEKSIVVVFHPLTSHPGVEDKDGDSVIRCSIQFIYHFTQLDDGTVETKMGLHINFGGNLPKAIVNGVVLPNFDQVISHTQAYFGCSILDLKKTDGKLLGELLINQIKKSGTITTSLKRLIAKFYPNI